MSKVKRSAKVSSTEVEVSKVDRMRGDIQKIAKSLASGTKMQDIRAEYGFGSGGQIRAALALNGYDSKGGAITLPTLPKSPKARAKAVAALRDSGTPWYILMQVTGLSEADVRDLADSAGGTMERVYRNSGESKAERAAKAPAPVKVKKAPAKVKASKGAKGEVKVRQMTKAERAAGRKARAAKQAEMQ